ncbi:hypothetical protein PCY08_09935, partial [Streptococcus sp. SO4]|nr:hypothetical protein [Streptococcus sp. SO4]
VKTPAVTPVANPSALTDAEKAKVAEEVKKANPTATDVKVGEEGTATVIFPDGSKATLTPAQTVKEADSNGVKTPAVTPVVNPSSLTDAEKAKVAEEVKKSNPTATDVKVGEDGTATVIFPDGSKATLTPAQTVKEADSNGVKTPAVTPVVNPSALTDAEKAKVAEEVKKSNPTATDVKVGEDGTATVIFSDGSKATLTPAQTVKEADKELKDPAVTPVTDPSNLTDAEKAKVAEEVKKSNPTVTDVKVGEDGTTTVTYPGGTTAVLPSNKTVKRSVDKELKDPVVIPVVNPSALTDSEKAKVAEEVKKSNPTVTDVKVGEDGTTTVTYPDGTTATLTPEKTVKEADSNGVNSPAVTPVVNPSALTDSEKA